MLMSKPLFSSSSPNKILTRSLASGFLATTGILIGFLPQFSGQATLTFNYAAYAQDFSQEQLQKYAQVVLSIEPHRQQAFEDIKQIINGAPPNIVCNQPSSYGSLPSDAQTIARNYCATSKQIVESNSLSVSQFNDITQRAQADEDLERRIQEAMLDIQQ